MKKIRLYLLLMASLLSLAACGKGEELPNPIINDMEDPSDHTLSTPDSSFRPSPESPAAEDDTLPPEEGMVRSRLTNEWVDADTAATRPIAVMIPNESSALPHYSLSKASVLYEANVEGRMTRMMAIYEDWKDLEKIGNIRSLRT